MLNKRTEQLADHLVSHGFSAPENRELIAFGLSATIEYLYGIGTMIALSMLFGLVFELVVFLGAFSYLRAYAGGYHCKTAFRCYLGSNGVVLSVLLAVRYTPSVYISWIMAGLLLLSIPTLILLAPMETPTKPLDEAERDHYRRKTRIHLILLLGILSIIYALGEREYAYAMCLGIGTTAGVVAGGEVNCHKSR